MITPKRVIALLAAIKGYPRNKVVNTTHQPLAPRYTGRRYFPETTARPVRGWASGWLPPATILRARILPHSRKVAYSRSIIPSIRWRCGRAPRARGTCSGSTSPVCLLPIGNKRRDHVEQSGRSATASRAFGVVNFENLPAALGTIDIHGRRNIFQNKSSRISRQTSLCCSSMGKESTSIQQTATDHQEPAVRLSTGSVTASTWCSSLYIAWCHQHTLNGILTLR